MPIFYACQTCNLQAGCVCIPNLPALSSSCNIIQGNTSQWYACLDTEVPALTQNRPCKNFACSMGSGKRTMSYATADCIFTRKMTE